MKSELDFAGLKDAANKLNQPERTVFLSHVDNLKKAYGRLSDCMQYEPYKIDSAYVRKQYFRAQKSMSRLAKMMPEYPTAVLRQTFQSLKDTLLCRIKKEAQHSSYPIFDGDMDQGYCEEYAL